jgi:arylsulfatase A-like enzyme/thioredoxin-like negative regulator of GroEL
MTSALSPRRLRALAVLPVIALAACGGASSHEQPLAPGSLRGWNVLLITIDTLRADHVGAYGDRRGLTPTLDRLAHEGVRVANAYAHVPMTLPSHATIMTGLYPYHNGVRGNVTFRLDRTQPTLAAALKNAGYRTAAFVGAFVLDARFGLNSGFDLYDDRMLGSGSSLEVVQRPAGQVLSAAADWMIQSRSPSTVQPPAQSRERPGPWFVWVHLYDPHEPYDPPEPYRTRYASDLYAGEVAYADAALGAFLDRLRASAMLDRTLVVATSDHGESLGDHGERTHGLFAYNATLRVPLIFWVPNRTAVEARQPARLVDLAPTILDLVGGDGLAGVDGRSIRPALGGDSAAADQPSYFEALNANLTRGWAPLRGVISGGWKLIDLPIPELYDLAADPAESRNLYATQRDRARPLESVLDRFMSGKENLAVAAVDPDAEARLRSLGYAAGSVTNRREHYTAADDPKRLVHLNAALDDAMAMWSRGDAQQAMAVLRQILQERPDLSLAHDRLAFMLRSVGQTEAALQVLDAAARAGHADPPLLRSLGSLLRETGHLDRSAAVLEALVQQDANDLSSADALGQTYTRMRRVRDAERMFRMVIASSPNAASTWNNLGTLYLLQNRNAEAVEALSRATAIDPMLAAAHNGLGVASMRLGRADKAIEEWREALRLRPNLEDARANLAQVGAR